MGFMGDVLGISDIASSVVNTGWNIYAQNKTWQREDTAVQRRVKDLQEAGLSPTLAAGSAASSSSPIKVDFPTSSFEKYKNMQLMELQKQTAQANLAYSEEQARLMKLQADQQMYKNMPMEALLRKPNLKFVMNDEEGIGLDDFLAYSQAQKMQMDFFGSKLSVDKMQAQKDLIVEQLNKVYHDLNLSEKYGVRSTDKVDAALEAIMGQLGNTTGPWATAASSLLYRFLPMLIDVMR